MMVSNQDVKALGPWPSPLDTQRCAHLLGGQPQRGRPPQTGLASQTPGHLPAPCTLVGEMKNAATQMVAQIPFGGQPCPGVRPGGLRRSTPSSPRQAAWVVSSLWLVWMELNLSGDYLLLILSDSLGREGHVALKSPREPTEHAQLLLPGKDAGSCSLHNSILSLSQGPARRRDD